MTNELETAIAALQEVVRSDAPGCAERIDGALARIFELHDDRAIGPLLLVLDDHYTFQELMWSVVHLAESYEADAYVATLVDVLPQIERSAPEWAYRLVGRVLNGDADRILFAKQLKRVVPERADLRLTMHKTLQHLCEEQPGTFESKVAEVRAGAEL